jgi:hypothetical protein
MAVIERPPLINGVEYTHADIVLELLGVPIIGVTSIEYSDVQNIEGNYATGHLPTSVGFGQVDLTATITITSVEFRRIVLFAPGRRLQNLPFFDVGVNFIPESGIFVRDRLVRCKFKGANISTATNNTQIEVPLELFVADIRYNR